MPKRWKVTQTLVWLSDGEPHRGVEPVVKEYRFKWVAWLSARINRGTPANYVLAALFRVETKLEEVTPLDWES